MLSGCLEFSCTTSWVFSDCIVSSFSFSSSICLLSFINFSSKNKGTDFRCYISKVIYCISYTVTDISCAKDINGSFHILLLPGNDFLRRPLIFEYLLLSFRFQHLCRRYHCSAYLRQTAWSEFKNKTSIRTFAGSK